MENKRKTEELNIKEEHKDEHRNNRKLFNYLLLLLGGVALTIGGTYAFFLFNVGNANVDVQSTPEISLLYSDNTTNMRKDLIPTSRENALKGILKDEDKCIDIYGYSACSLYEFTVTNDSDATQVINITMTPLENEYKNLEFILYSGKIDEITSTSTPIINNQSLTYNSLTPITFNNLTETILANREVSYTLVLYINDIGKNQIEDDSDKSFRANINVNSITTGQYINQEING